MDVQQHRHDRTNIKWETAQGDIIPVKSMEHSHLQNTILLLSRKQTECTAHGIGDYVWKGKKAADWVELLKNELTYRSTPRSTPDMTDLIEALTKEALAKYPEKATEYRAGKKGLLGLFVGEVMKASKGKAEPKLTNKIVTEKLETLTKEEFSTNQQIML